MEPISLGSPYWKRYGSFEDTVGQPDFFFHSWVKAMPWLGQPWGICGRGVAFHFDFQSTLVTSTELDDFAGGHVCNQKPRKLLLLA